MGRVVGAKWLDRCWVSGWWVIGTLVSAAANVISWGALLWRWDVVVGIVIRPLDGIVGKRFGCVLEVFADANAFGTRSDVEL